MPARTALAAFLPRSHHSFTHKIRILWKSESQHYAYVMHLFSTSFVAWRLKLIFTLQREWPKCEKNTSNSEKYFLVWPIIWIMFGCSWWCMHAGLGLLLYGPYMDHGTLLSNFSSYIFFTFRIFCWVVFQLVFQTSHSTSSLSQFALKNEEAIFLSASMTDCLATKMQLIWSFLFCFSISRQFFSVSGYAFKRVMRIISVEIHFHDGTEWQTPDDSTPLWFTGL